MAVQPHDQSGLCVHPLTTRLFSFVVDTLLTLAVLGMLTGATYFLYLSFTVVQWEPWSLGPSSLVIIGFDIWFYGFGIVFPIACAFLWVKRLLRIGTPWRWTKPFVALSAFVYFGVILFVLLLLIALGQVMGMV